MERMNCSFSASSDMRSADNAGSPSFSLFHRAKRIWASRSSWVVPTRCRIDVEMTSSPDKRQTPAHAY